VILVLRMRLFYLVKFYIFGILRIDDLTLGLALGRSISY